MLAKLVINTRYVQCETAKQNCKAERVADQNLLVGIAELIGKQTTVVQRCITDGGMERVYLNGSGALDVSWGLPS